MEILKFVREIDEVEVIFSQDPDTKILINTFNDQDLIQLQKDYPDLLPNQNAPIYSVNVITSKMLTKSGYRKIRYYIDGSGQIIREFSTSNSNAQIQAQNKYTNYTRNQRRN